MQGDKCIRPENPYPGEVSMAVGDWHGLLACGLAAPVAVVVVAGLLQGTSRPDLDPEGFRAVYRAVWAALVLVGAGVTWRWLVGRRGGG